MSYGQLGKAYCKVRLCERDAIGDGEDLCGRHAVERDAREKRSRGQNLLVWCMRRTKFKAADVMSEAEREGDINRASHLCQCSICGQLYIDHPTIKEFPDLHVTCEWKVYKL